MSNVVFFSTWHLLGNRVSKTRFLNQKNFKKFEVSCKAEIPKNKYKKKTSIPILKTQIRGRERSEGEKDLDQRERDSSRGDPGRPKSRRPRHASLRPRWPRHVSLRPGSRTAWGSRSLGRPGARAPGLGRAQWSEATNSDFRSRSSLPFCFWGFFFFSWVLLWCSGGSSLTWSYL